jgi:hypothetical protein
MNHSILRRFAPSKPPRIRHHFQPSSTSDLFALRLAVKLGDAPAVDHYLDLLARYGPGTLLTAYTRAVNSGPAGIELARVFHRELEGLNGRSFPVRTQRLLAVRIERRTVAMAVLKDVHLEYVKSRQLSSFSGKALASAAHFFERVLDDYPPTSAVLESVPLSRQGQRTQIVNIMEEILGSRGVAITSVHRREVLAAFGNPPLRSRSQLRNVVQSIWPVLDMESGAPCARDAAGLGLYVQTECLFNT